MDRQSKTVSFAQWNRQSIGRIARRKNETEKALIKFKTDELCIQKTDFSLFLTHFKGSLRFPNQQIIFKALWYYQIDGNSLWIPHWECYSNKIYFVYWILFSEFYYLKRKKLQKFSFKVGKRPRCEEINIFM